MYHARLRRLPEEAHEELAKGGGLTPSLQKGIAARYQAANAALKVVSDDGPVAASKVRTLIVDEDTSIRDTFTAILSGEGYETHCATAGNEALECLKQSAFDIMLCDLCLPDIHGMDLLRQTLTLYPEMPVILLSGNGSVGMAREALHEGASDFIVKPCSPAQLPIVVERNLTRQALNRKNTLRHKIALETSNEGVLDALLTALSTRDTETEGHSERVTAYTMELADRMGIPPKMLYHIERGALLHDIGKIGIPDRILHKPGPLTEEEWVEMRKHPVIGYRMCVRVAMLQEAAQIVLRHHESWEGGGYPDGLSGDAIPLGARLFAVADTLDAMTSSRPYRAACSFAEARAEIARCSGTQFDPQVVAIFLSIPEDRWQALRSLAYK